MNANGRAMLSGLQRNGLACRLRASNATIYRDRSQTPFRTPGLSQFFFKCYQIDERGGQAGLEVAHEVDAEDVVQELLEREIDTCPSQANEAAA